jgi:hypothetical protein
MKRFATLLIASSLFVCTLSGCRETYSYEETQLEATVTECTEGNFHPDAAYMATANAYLAQQNYGLYSTYLALANNNGKYDYNITVTLNNESYTVVRDEKVDVGTTITITKVDTYGENSEYIKTTYQ